MADLEAIQMEFAEEALVTIAVRLPENRLRAVSFIISLNVLPLSKPLLFSGMSMAIYHSLVTFQTNSVLQRQQAG